MATKTQLLGIMNTALADQQPILARHHRDQVTSMLDELYNAQSRGNVLAGLPLTSLQLANDTFLAFRNGAALQIPFSSIFDDPLTLGTPNGLKLDGQVLSLGLASADTTGALSSTDFNIFINKIGGAIQTGQVAFGTAANTVGGDNGLVYDNTSRVLTLNTNAIGNQNAFIINNSVGSPIITVTGTLITGPSANFANTVVNSLVSNNFSQLGFSSFIRFGGMGGNGRSIISSPPGSGGKIMLENNARTGFNRLHFGGITSAFPSIKIVSTALHLVNGDDTSLIQLASSSLLINTTTDEGFRLDVNGIARIQDIPNGVGDFITRSATGVLQHRKAVEVVEDLNIKGAFVTIGTDQTITGAKVFSQDLIVNGMRIGRGLSSQNTNTFIGTNTGVDSTFFSESNSFFGFSAGQNNTDGSSNTSIGVLAGQRNTTGGANTTVGSAALRFNITGGGNTSIGASSGLRIANSDQLTKANNSVFIGDNTRALDNDQTNQIVIGNDAIGAGDNSVVIGHTTINKTVLRGTINAANLPTSSAGLSAGDIFNDNGTLKIV